MAACIFCKIVKGDIPSFKLFESDKILAYLDIQPLSKGHALVIPKHHGAKLTDIPDDQLAEILPAAKKIATAVGAENYNILQNNGRLAHQVVDHVRYPPCLRPNLDVRDVTLGRYVPPEPPNHVLETRSHDLIHFLAEGKLRADIYVHFHIIPKPNDQEGLGIGWPAQQTDMDGLKKLHEALRAKM